MVARIILLLLYTLDAQASLPFKKDITVSSPWMPCVLIMILLFIILWVLARYVGPKTGANQKAKIIDNIAIHHKTKAYVLDYQGQHFLIAENQNAIAIHAFKKGDSQS